MTDVTARPWWDWREMPAALYVASRTSPLDSVSGRVPDDPDRGWKPYPGAQPCKSDPATLGCLTQRARELNHCPGLGFYCDHVTGLWLPGDPLWLPPWLANIAARSEWAALVAACDAAPSTSKERSP